MCVKCNSYTVVIKIGAAVAIQWHRKKIQLSQHSRLFPAYFSYYESNAAILIAIDTKLAIELIEWEFRDGCIAGALIFDRLRQGIS